MGAAFREPSAVQVEYNGACDAVHSTIAPPTPSPARRGGSWRPQIVRTTRMERLIWTFSSVRVPSAPGTG